VIPQLFLIAVATFASEDLTCIATGVLVAQGKLSFLDGVLACFAGILAGDVLLFLTGRIAGARALRWRPFARFLTPERVARGAEWLERKGVAVVFLSRFTPGLRLPTYFAAGMLPTRASSFLLYFLIASAIWTPVAVGVAAVFGEEVLHAIFVRRGETLAAFAITFGIVLLIFRGITPLLRAVHWRRLSSTAGRLVRWEFWPPWASYLPLAPYLLFLAVRHRSLTLFTAANPGIPTGGFAGESKSGILSHLQKVDNAVAPFTVLPASLDRSERIVEVQRFGLPVVLKPDIGERGVGVSIARTEAELEGCLKAAPGDTIVQQYVPGVEFGVFYYRYPHESRGRISSITEKRFPIVVGDGRHSLRELILRDPRAGLLVHVYEKLCKRSLDEAPSAGEVVQLVEIGSHCRGAVFLDGSHLKTPELEDAIDRVSQAHPGFYFGRFDIRAPSAEAFRRGEFRVIELNGVSAEATHIYDPSVSVLEAYRVMCRHWCVAFEIGAANRARGFSPTGWRAFVRLAVRCGSSPKKRSPSGRANSELRSLHGRSNVHRATG
jgi:membrane protein DedA with SNARE-associated domain